MVYQKTQWVEGGVPGISAANLNKIEQGIADAVTKTGTLPDGTDINTVVTTGFYRLGVSLVNEPAEGLDYGQLIVSSGGDTVFQIGTGYNGNNLFFMRHGNPPEAGGSGSWHPWQKLYNEGFPPHVAGTFTGTGGYRQIGLPFWPTAVLVMLDITSQYGSGHSGLATRGSEVFDPVSGAVTIAVNAGGFSLDGNANVPGAISNYVAFR